MPAIALGSAETAYADPASTVTMQLVGKDGEATTLATWTYDSENTTYVDDATGEELAIVEDYSSSPLVYTGLNKKPDPRCLSVTTKGIPFEDLFNYASNLAQGINMRGDTAMYISDASGYKDEFTYDQYWGLTRYNYMNWYNQETYSADFSDWSDGVEVESTLAIVGYHAAANVDKGDSALSTVEYLASQADDSNALRISVGQQFEGNKVIEDSWVHTGSNGGSGDINEGNLSVKNVNLIKFTPVYNAISVDGGEASGTEGVEGYSVAVENGTVSTSDNWFKAAAGETVTLLTTPAEGYSVSEISVFDDAGDEIAAEAVEGGYAFEMSALPVTVEVTFAEGEADTSAAWDGTADTSWYNADDPQAEYVITTAEQLAGLAELVDGGNDFAGVTIKLGNDIVLNAEGSTDNNWNPIGIATDYAEFDTGISGYYGTIVKTVADGSLSFAGTFDGQGHEVSGLYISASDNGQGLFAYNTGTIKNFTISGTIAKAGGDFVGAAAGFNAGTIADVVSQVTITVGSSNVGGIVGYNDGYMDGSVGLVIRCGNDADVTGSSRVGGIAGESTGTTQYCYNKATVKGTSDSKNGIGGIVGRLGCAGGAITTPKILDCYNSGPIITGVKWVGGITGFLNPGATIWNCYASDFTTTGSLNNYSNPIAGCVDYSGAGDVQNVYSLSTLKSKGSWYEEVGTRMTEDEMKEASFPSLLGGAFAADDAASQLNNGYPVLFWERGLTMGTVSVDKAISFGAVTASMATATQTNEVTVTVAEARGYQLKAGSLAYTTDGETHTEITANDEGVYSFAMPAGDVTITAEFEYAGGYWDGESIDIAWYNATDTVFVITTAQELAGFAAIVNGTATDSEGAAIQDDFAGKTVQLGANIALAENGLYNVVEGVSYTSNDGVGKMTTTQHYLKEKAPVWTPIGSCVATSNSNVSGSSFAGTFDGKGFAVSGVYTGTKSATEANTATVQGLFGLVKGGTVQNVTVSGLVGGSIVLGGVVAYLQDGTVYNCVNKAVVFSDVFTPPNGRQPYTVGTEGEPGYISDTNYLGVSAGIVGTAAGTSTVERCINEGWIICTGGAKGDGRVAGIVGLIDATSDAVSIYQCGNEGAITGYQYVAGVLGSDWSEHSSVDQCYNAGDIAAYGSQYPYAGGIVAYYNNSITNCYNTGDMTFPSSPYSAGSGGITGAYSSRAQTHYNCYTTGTLTGGGDLRSLGMIIGKSGTAENCYYLDTAKENSASAAGEGGGISKTADEMKSADFLTLINVDNAGAFVSDAEGDASINDGFPVLGWQLGAEEPIAVSTKYEGAFVFEYFENQKFSIGDFKLYTVYNNDGTTELTDYTVYLDDEQLDTSSYVFTQDDNGKTLKITWTPNGNETSYVENTLVINDDYLTTYNTKSGSVKLEPYFVGDVIDTTTLTSMTYNRMSGTTMTAENADLVFSVKTADGKTFAADVALTSECDGATLAVSYTWRDETVDYNLGALVVLDDLEPVDGVYQLATADDVVWFTAKVNSGATETSANLTANIDLTDVTTYKVNNYAGTFDGNGMTLTSTSALFNSVSTGTVKKLVAAGTRSGNGIGGVVNTVNGAAVIEGCVNEATVTSNTTWGGTIGGIVGKIDSAASGAKIVNCINKAEVKILGMRSNNAGGIVGNADCADATITGCVNTAAVSANVMWGNNAGGIAGASKASIDSCYNTGAISVGGFQASSTAGGLVGVQSGSATISNSYNAGTASHGAIVASVSDETTVTNVYALEDTCGNLFNSGTPQGEAAFKTADALAAAAMVETLNGAEGTAWAKDAWGSYAINNGYPVLAWQLVGLDIPDYVLGDVDGNGEIEPRDATLILQYCSEIIDADGINVDAADVDGNGEIEPRDATLILQYCSEIISAFPAA